VRYVIVIAVSAMLLGCTATAHKRQPCRFVIHWNSSPPERERAIWLAYLMFRVDHADPTTDCGPTETIVVPTFEQEVQARNATLKTYHSIQKRDPELDISYFNDLSRVSDAGFLREYVWVYLRQESWSQNPLDLRLVEFDTWRQSNLSGHIPQTQGAIAVVRARHDQPAP
jgi:hypothetical protein